MKTIKNYIYYFFIFILIILLIVGFLINKKSSASKKNEISNLALELKIRNDQLAKMQKNLFKNGNNINNLINQNTLLQSQISNFTEKDSSLIESKARFKYGLIKEGEYFFKIKKIIETDNSAENSESAL